MYGNAGQINLRLVFELMEEVDRFKCSWGPMWQNEGIMKSLVVQRTSDCKTLRN